MTEHFNRIRNDAKSPAWQKRDLTWLEPRDQQERIRMLDRLDAALMGAHNVAGALGQITTDYAGIIESLRQNARKELQLLLADLDVEALQNQQDRAHGLYGDGMTLRRFGE